MLKHPLKPNQLGFSFDATSIFLIALFRGRYGLARFMPLLRSLENIRENGDAIDMALPDGAWEKRGAKED
jgi:hypothetical protein